MSHAHQYTTNGDRYRCPSRAMDDGWLAAHRAVAEDEWHQEDCSNPPAESCADAGCPVHGDPLDEQSRLFPMADADEISHAAIFEARRLTVQDAARVQRRPWLTP